MPLNKEALILNKNNFIDDILKNEDKKCSKRNVLSIFFTFDE